MKIYPIRLSLATNPRTPIAIARRLVPSLGQKDLRNISRSKCVSTLVAGEARRLLTK
jgi:hypothetical protein